MTDEERKEGAGEEQKAPEEAPREEAKKEVKNEAPAPEEKAEKPSAEAPAQEKPFGRKGRGPGRRPFRRQKQQEAEDDGMVERVVRINRVSKVVKGGKNFSFSAMVVTGDGNGNVGIGFGKSNEVVEAIRKGSTEARKNQKRINLKGDTIPHEIIGRFKATHVMLKPAGPGTGVIAGGAVRAVCDAAGIKNILTKSLGSRNSANVVKATMDGFEKLRLARRG